MVSTVYGKNGTKELPRGYRFLRIGESTQSGDLAFSTIKGDWVATPILGAKIENGLNTSFARPVGFEPEKTLIG